MSTKHNNIQKKHEKIKTKLIFLFFMLLPIFIHAQVGINTTTPNAMLDVNSTNNGMLVPRVALTSTIDITTVVNPQGGALVNSTLVYNTATAGVIPNNIIPGFYYWDTTQSKWIPIGGRRDWLVSGNTAITTPANPVIYGTSTIGATENFIGTTDNNDVTIGTNTIERMRVLSSGNIGIGMATAPAKLSVQSAFSSPTIPNTTTNAFLRIGSNNEGLDFGKAGAANNYAAWFQSGYNGIITDPISLQPLGGNVGIGTTNPSRLLHLNSTTSGAVRIVDGTQGINKVLTSDATGVATWQNVGIDNVVGVLSGTGVDIAYNQTANFLQTGSTITLPPGRYAVNVTMLLARNSTASMSPNNSFFWVRSTFSDSAAANPLPSPDIVGSTLASGNFGGTSLYSLLNGTIIIDNTTAGNKTYYYVAGRTVFSNTTETLTGIGSTYWAENNIIAYRLN